ncbi:MAG: hypothetical protein V1661_00760 [bacterium]
MNEIILIDLPAGRGCWYSGYPVHRGESEESVNYATIYANKKHIIPDQAILKNDFNNFVKILKSAGFVLHILPFPEVLNQPDDLHHDAVFARDAGLMFGDYWIKARFNVLSREAESDVCAEMISKKFGKKILEPPPGAYLEFGETFFLQTQDGSYYFGGLSRANEEGHDFVRTIVNPDNYCLIKSKGYHLDTVFSPVLNSENELAAFVVAEEMLSPESLNNLKKFNVEIISVDLADSSGTKEKLGNCAVNSLVAPGVMINSAKFLTPGVETRIAELGIKRFIAPLSYFHFAGGSCHCLTNEIYK